MNNMHIFDLGMYLEVVELALLHGKKEGDDMTAELEEVSRKYTDKIKFIGTTDMDADMLAGNMRENGYKILNMKEIERRNNDQNTKL